LLADTENFKYKLEGKEEELKESKRFLKTKIDELSEVRVRIGLLEKKNELAHNEFVEKEKKFLQTLDELKTNSMKKEK
jgi:hypothetical protein